MYDSHLHMEPNALPGKRQFLEGMKKFGITGGSVFSVPPPRYRTLPGVDQRFQTRIQEVMEFTDGTEFRPFLFLDPTADDAMKQVEYAAAHGIQGFKVICSWFRPSEALSVFRAIAETDLPLHFHSGAIWDENEDSCKYNRPMEFEPLILIPKLRFAMAHFSWPWTDEMIALFGKISYVRSVRPEACAELFVDPTPGTPPIYRKEVFRRLLYAGYPVENRLLWGSDSTVNDFDPAAVTYWLPFDRKVVDDIAREMQTPEGRALITPWSKPIDGDKLFRAMTQDNFKGWYKQS